MNSNMMNDAVNKTETGYTLFQDYGPAPFVVDIEEASERNNTYRTALWTGDHLQLTLMSLNPGEDIGLEMHPEVDQFIRIEEGRGVARLGPDANEITLQENVCPGYAVLIPAGTWHDVTNTGNTPMKIYTLYGPPNHPRGTVHLTKADARAAAARE